MGSMEILAPAGSMEALTAAVRCGADAVYLGGKVLNARRNASNFEDAELREAVAYCHLRGVNVYQTLNTLAFDSELEQVERTVCAACKNGVDACIVQDLGVASLIRQIAPRMPLHASTQMSVHSKEGVRELERMGFSRVVLARELSFEEIRSISQASDLELECFVHGALCYCVSGQCTMSALFGGRSGNRGLCAQPCRLPFGGKGDAHSLSLKDLSLLEKLPELEAAGVVSLKIEGRMKRPEYVAAAVTACKQSMKGKKADLSRLRAVFSRSGFTSGYFEGQRASEMRGIRQKEDVQAAGAVLDELATLYKEEKSFASVTMELVLEAGKPSLLIIRDCDGNEASAEGEIPQIAKTTPTDRERALASLSKLGGTPYKLEGFTCRIGPGLMLPVSALNRLRREAVDALERACLQKKIVPTANGSWYLPKAPDAAVNTPPAIWTRIDRAAQLTGQILDKSDRIIVPADLLDSLPEGMLEQASKFIVEIPAVLFSGRNKLDQILEQALAMGIRDAYAGSLDAIGIGRRHGFALHGAHSLNITNTQALEEYRKLGLRDAVLSFELRISQAASIRQVIPAGLIVYGRLPLMISRLCPLGGEKSCRECGNGFGKLTDRKGASFPVECRWGAHVIFNSVPLYLADKLGDFQRASHWILSFTDESPRRCEGILRAYQGEEDMEMTSKTRGLYYRGVL